VERENKENKTKRAGRSVLLFFFFFNASCLLLKVFSQSPVESQLATPLATPHRLHYGMLIECINKFLASILGCENGASLYVYIVPTSDFALFTVTIVCVIMEIDFPSFRVLKLCSFLLIALSL